MTIANLPQGTGPLTLEQGVAQLSAKLAQKGATIEDAVIVHPDDPNEETEAEAPVEEAAAEENAEAVSEDASEADKEPEPDNRPVLLPDGSEITVEEARKGYLRQADWTRKTQDLARMREAVEAEKQVEIKKISDLHQQLSQLQETEPNWLELARDPNTDPKQLQAAQAYWQHKKTVMTETQRRLEESQSRQLQSQKAAAFQALTESRLEPKWKDPKALKSALDELSTYWVDIGLPAEMLEGVTHPAIIETLEKARRYDTAMANKPKATLAVKGKPAPVKPGARSAASPQSEQLRLLTERFNKNPTIENATALERAKGARR